MPSFLWPSVALLAYTYVGYPLAIAALARVFPDRESTDGEADWEPRVTACVPVHDGEAYLAAKIASLSALEYPREKLELLFFSDGSTDGTVGILREAAARDPRIRILESERRAGKPTALNAMRRAATGEVLLLTDARQTLSPGSLRALVATLAPAGVGCASGNLVLEGAAGAGAYWRYEKWIRRNEARFRSMLGVTGAIYAVRRSDMVDLPVDLILDDMWVPMRLRLQGRTIRWCEEAEAFDTAFGDDKEFARKVRTLAGNYQLFALLPGLLSPAKNPSFLETISHKALRLAGPVLLAVTLVESARVSLSPPGRARVGVALARAILGGQLGLYTLAALGPRAKKAGSIARTFVVMNAAAAMGFVRFASGSQLVTW